MAAKLGRSSDSVKAQRLLAGISAIIEPSWTPEDEAMLGRFTDAEIARRTGRSNSAVWLRRKQLGIPPVPKANYHNASSSRGSARPLGRAVPKTW